MHRSIPSFVLSLLLGAALIAAAEGDELPSGPYFGQSPPGQEAEVFAPEVISREGRYEFALSFSPGGERLLFTVQTASGLVQVLQSRVSDGVWTLPAPVHLSAGARKDEMEAFFSRDGKYVYFAPYNEGLDVRLWSVEMDGGDFVNPAPLPGPIAEAPAFFPTSAASGALYYTQIQERRPYRARRDRKGAWQVEPIDIEFGGHVFVASDESFLLVDARAEDSLGGGDLYVAFATPSGAWSRPVHLGDEVNSKYSESCPTLSDDGKFLFFSRYDEPGEVAQIYWIDSAVIEDARDRRGVD